MFRVCRQMARRRMPENFATMRTSRRRANASHLWLNIAMAARSVTLAHVALAAHVSVSTASAALRGSAKVNADTAAHVREVAAGLGYRSNSAAAGLRRGDPSWWASCSPRAAFDPDPTSPRLFWPRFLTGFADGLAVLGHGMVVVTEQSGRLLRQTPIHAVAMAADPQADGLSLVPFGTPVLRFGDPRAGDLPPPRLPTDRGAGRRQAGGGWPSPAGSGLRRPADPGDEPPPRLPGDCCQRRRGDHDRHDDCIAAPGDCRWRGRGRHPGTDVPGILRLLAEAGHRVPADVAVMSIAGRHRGQCTPR